MKILSAQNLFTMKQETFEFEPEWQEIFGTPDTTGAWLIQGKEKNGKTQTALIIAKLLSQYKRILYVSGEEGFAPSFINVVERSGIIEAHKIGFLPYTSIEDLHVTLKKRNAPKVVFLDNLTVYSEEFKRDGFDKFYNQYKDTKLIVFLTHEERNEPATAAGRRAKKFAKVLIHVTGLVANIGGRCPGGKLIINEERADKYGYTLESN